MFNLFFITTFLLLTQAQASPQLIDVAQIDQRFNFDIVYATPNNFIKEKVYPLARCLIRKEVAGMLQKAQTYLDAHHKGYTLLFKDCYRPEHVQFKMWEVVKNTPQQKYVANPNTKTGSVHNYAAAVDVTLTDKTGHEVDMGTKHDHLGALSEIRYEEKHLKEGKLTHAQIAHRKILRDAMTKGGKFKTIRTEWWHFDAWQGQELRRRYKKLDIPLTVKISK
ncbi:MAG: M15 family metallopeptidase [Myxococcota bacterium]|jgi:D-alanyl-D-alanine dipeptidase|nr:M15 family metallopeptidase [Myxococcota bacterium]